MTAITRRSLGALVATAGLVRPGTQKAFAGRKAFEAFCRGLGP